MLRLIDIGANLGHRSFERDREAVIGRAEAAGVDRIIVTGTSLPQSKVTIAIASHRPGRVWSTAGVHPHHAADWDAGSAEALRALAKAPEVVAIGECGLDFERDFSPRPAQRQAFEAQLELAAELKRPVFLHERAASEELCEILRVWRPRLGALVVHCFTGNAEVLERYLGLDLHIGITGWICDERRGRHLLALMSKIPRDRLMLETDAPFLFPRSLLPEKKGKPGKERNEPANLREVLRTVAAAMGRSEEEVAADTTQTAERFFGLPT